MAENKDMLDPTSIEARMKYGRPEDVGSIENEDKGWMEKFGQLAQETGEAFGLERSSARKLGSAATLIGESAPIAGDVNDINEVRRAAAEGDLGGMALSSIGIIPFIGNTLKRGAKATMDVFNGADDAVKKEAIRLTSLDLGRVPNPDREEDVRFLVQNAANVERDMIVSAGRVRKDAPRAEDRADWLTRDTENPELYHSTKNKFAKDSIEYEGFNPSSHSELGYLGTSVSRDPIYSIRHFGDSDVNKMFSITLSPEEAKQLQKISPEEYSVMRETKTGGMDNPLLDEATGLQLPKVKEFASEHETVVFKPNPANVKLLARVNPEKAAMLQEGVDKASDVFTKQNDLMMDISKLSSSDKEYTIAPAEARILYKRIRDNLTGALDLAKYTEDNSARGTFDWYIKNWADGSSAQVMDDDAIITKVVDLGLIDEDEMAMYLDDVGGYFDAEEFLGELDLNYDEFVLDNADVFTKEEMLDGLQVVRRSLAGEQNTAHIDSMIDAINRYDNKRYTSQREYGESARQAKRYDPTRARDTELKKLKDQYEMGMLHEADYKDKVNAAMQDTDKKGFMDLADKMNKGGLVV